MDKDIEMKLFRLFFIEQKKMKIISNELNLSYSDVSKSYNLIKNQHLNEYNEVVRLRNNIFNAKKNKFKTQFKFNNFPDFYDWWMKQGDKCGYCKTDQYKIRELVKAGSNGNPLGLTSKRFGKRAINLELERKDSKINDYSENNCILACYFCNNDKSDVIHPEDYYSFSNTLTERKEWIDKKYEELKKKR